MKYLRDCNWDSIVSIMTMLNRSYDCILICGCYFIYEVFCITKVNSALCDVRHTVIIQALSDLCCSYVPEDMCKSSFVHVGIECMYAKLCRFIQGSPAEIHTASHWYMITCSMIALPPLSLPSNILPLSSSHCAVIPTRKNWACLKNIVISIFYFLKLCLKYIT